MQHGQGVEEWPDGSKYEVEKEKKSFILRVPIQKGKKMDKGSLIFMIKVNILENSRMG